MRERNFHRATERKKCNIYFVMEISFILGFSENKYFAKFGTKMNIDSKIDLRKDNK